jgi:hypothetical protein
MMGTAMKMRRVEVERLELRPIHLITQETYWGG